MNTLVLCGVLCCLPASDDKLLDRLDAEYEASLATERQAVDVRRAAQLMAETNASDRWTHFLDAVRILRMARAKAGIPLLMKYMIVHAASNTRNLEEYIDTLAILSGQEMATPQRHTQDRVTPVREAVEKLLDEWWLPRKQTITTDVEKMTPAQRQVVVERLLRKAERGDRYRRDRHEREVTAYTVYHLMYYGVLSHSSHDQRGWWPEELTGAMTPPLLARLGYDEKPTEATARSREPVYYPAIAMLAELRKNREAPQLDKVADDARQPPATRLAAILALRVAGEELRTTALLQIIEAAQDQETRLAAIFALRESDDRLKAGAKLVEWMDDPNQEIRTAAICALAGPRPPQALPKLKKVVDEMKPQQSMLFVFDVIGRYPVPEARQILASYLEAALEDQAKAEYLTRALNAFETATGKHWSGAGAQSDEFYRAQAREAVQWWKSEGRTKAE